MANINKLKFILLMTFFLSSHSFSNPIESIDNIKNTAKQFVIANTQLEPDETLEVNINQNSSQFQVQACSKPLRAELPKNGNKEVISTVELACEGDQPWRIFVPVDVQIFTKVLTAKRTLAAKEMLTEEDIDYTMANKNRLYTGYFTKKEEILGNVTTHVITAGSLLTKKNVQLPILIYKNQTISLIAKSNAVVVTMAGVAKTDGALNSMIKVFNPSSKRTLDAIVIGPNKAQVVT